MRTNIIFLALAMVVGSLCASANVERHCTTHRNAKGVLVKTCKGKATTKHGTIVGKRNCKKVVTADGRHITKCAGESVKVHKPGKAKMH